MSLNEILAPQLENPNNRLQGPQFKEFRGYIPTEVMAHSVRFFCRGALVR